MNKRCGLSLSIWLWRAVIAMPLSRGARITRFTSLPIRTKSPVTAALDLALEPFERDLRRGLRREHLDHDRAVERGLLGDEHARHPTAAEFALERIASAQGRLQLVAEIRRRQVSLRSLRRYEVSASSRSQDGGR